MATAVGDRHTSEVVVLDQHRLGETPAVVVSSARTHRGLLERPQARGRLPGVEYPGGRVRLATAATKSAVSDATPDRWPRKLNAVRSEVRIDRSGPADFCDDVAGFHLGPVEAVPCHDEFRVDLGEGLDRTGATGDHPGLPADDDDGRTRRSRHQRGGQVTEREHVLCDRAGHRLTTACPRRVERDGRVAAAGRVGHDRARTPAQLEAGAHRPTARRPRCGGCDAASEGRSAG